MASDFDLTGRVRLDTSEVDGIAGRIGNSFRNMAAVASLALGGIGIAGIGKAAIGVAADFEQTTIAFNTMLGSGERAQVFLKDLQGFAAKTPFEFPELASAASALVSIGIETDKVIPIMTTLGNTTAGMGTGQEGIKRATVALQQMNAAGRITGEDLNQLRDAGIPVFDLLAAATGKSKEEVSQLAQAGKLGKKELTQLMKALETGKGLERFAGLMDAQSRTLNGVISTLRDTLSNAAIDIITPYLPVMAAGVQLLSDRFTELTPAIRSTIDIGVAGMSALVDAFKDGEGSSIGFAGSMSDLGKVLGVLYDIVSAVTGFLVDHGEATKNTAVAVLTLVAAYQAMKIVEGVSAGVNAMTETLIKNHKAVTKGATETQKLVKNIEALGPKAVKISQDGAEAATLKVMYLQDAIKELKDKVVKVTTEFQDKHFGEDAGKVAGKGFLQGFSGGIGAALAGAVAAAVAGIAAAVGVPVLLVALGVAAVAAAGVLIWTFREQIGNFFTKTVPELISDAEFGVKVLADKGRQAIEAFRDGAVTGFETVKKWLTELPSNIGYLVDFGAMMIDKGRQALEALRDGADRGFETFKQWLADVPSSIAYALGYGLGTLYKFGTDLITGLWNGAQAVYTTVSQWVIGLPQAIVNLLGDVSTWLYEKGYGLLTGFWNGAQAVYTTVSQWVIGLPQAIVNLLGDVSTWLYEKGHGLLTGFWNGIQVAWSVVSTFFTTLGTTILEWLADANNWLVGKGRDLLTGLWNGIQYVWNEPRAFFTSLPGVVGGFFADAGNWLLAKGRDLLTGLWNGIQEGWRAVTDFFSTLADKIRKAVGDTLEWLKQAGINIITGLVKGIEEAYGKAIDKAKSLGSDFVKGFNDSIRAKSPSRLMADAGRNIMDGLIVGIDSRESAFMGKVDDMAAALAPITNADISLGGSNRLQSAVNGAIGMGGYPMAAGGESISIGDIHLHGVTDGASVRAVLPELADAIAAGVGRR